MVNACPTFLAKHPAYLRYVREAASGELVMPEYERVGGCCQVLLDEQLSIGNIQGADRYHIQRRMRRTVGLSMLASNIVVIQGAVSAL